MSGEASPDAELSKIVSDLTAYIDKSHCGYCKAILGDAKTIIESYGQIQTEAVVMDKLQHDRNDMLQETQRNAMAMIQKQLPPDQATGEGWSLMRRRPNGPGQRVKSNKFVKWVFGDFFEGLF